MTPHFNTAKERQEYHASLPLSEKRCRLERAAERDERHRQHGHLVQRAKELKKLKEGYRKNEEQRMKEEAAAMVKRNDRAWKRIKQVYWKGDRLRPIDRGIYSGTTIPRHLVEQQ